MFSVSEKYDSVNKRTLEISELIKLHIPGVRQKRPRNLSRQLANVAQIFYRSGDCNCPTESVPTHPFVKVSVDGEFGEVKLDRVVARLCRFRLKRGRFWSAVKHQRHFHDVGPVPRDVPRTREETVR